jgi:hypothetical protein
MLIRTIAIAYQNQKGISTRLVYLVANIPFVLTEFMTYIVLQLVTSLAHIKIAANSFRVIRYLCTVISFVCNRIDISGPTKSKITKLQNISKMLL